MKRWNNETVKRWNDKMSKWQNHYKDRDAKIHTVHDCKYNCEADTLTTNYCFAWSSDTLFNTVHERYISITLCHCSQELYIHTLLIKIDALFHIWLSIQPIHRFLTQSFQAFNSSQKGYFTTNLIIHWLVVTSHSLVGTRLYLISLLLL